MFCSKCGAQLTEGAKFCEVCGSPVQADTNTKQIDPLENRAESRNSASNAALSTTATSVVAYMTWIGFLIAYFGGDREGAKFFLNQALVFNLFFLACLIPFIGWLWGIYMLVCFILGVIWAAEQKETELPLIGMIKILN